MATTKPLGLLPKRSVLLLVAASLILTAAGTWSLDRASGATWSPSVMVDVGFDVGSLRMAATPNGIYLVSWAYSLGPVYIYKSVDNGASWSPRKSVFGMELWWAAPSVCAYTVGGSDHILVAANPGFVAKSVDGGASFSRLADLPLMPNVQWWGYPHLSTNASWHSTVPDSDIYAVGSMYIGVPWTGTHVVSFTKSHNNGSTWSTPKTLCDLSYTTYWPQLVSDGESLYVIYTRLTSDLTYEGLYAMKSTDWGETWSTPARVVDGSSIGVFVNSVQPITPAHSMMVLVDSNTVPANVTMLYGYFDYESLRFVEVGREAGSQWDFTYCGVGAYLTNTDDFLLGFVYDDGYRNPLIRYTHSSDTGLEGAPRYPEILNTPWGIARVNELYSFNASATPPDYGTSTWSFYSNASWLSVSWSNETYCLLQGTPSEIGSYWGELTVQDLNSSDTVNWTIQVLPERVVHWATPVVVGPTTSFYFGLDLELSAKNAYAMSWIANNGPVTLFRSFDNGTAWESRDVLQSPAPEADPGMCVYGNGSEDVILVASGPNKVLKSEDSGDTFSSLTDLPTSSIALEWRYLAIDTNASWFGGTPDEDIYVVGSRWIDWPTPMYALSFTKSVDGGKTWKTPLTLAGLSYATGCPELISDGNRLYVVYTGLDGAHSDLYLKYSDDFGATWSTQQVLVKKQAASEMMIPYALQYLSDKRALLTLAEYGDFNRPPYLSIGRYGYLNFSSLRFEEAWNVSGDEWLICWGFAGALKDNSNLTLAWLMEDEHHPPLMTNKLMFTYSLDSRAREDEMPVARFSVTPSTGSVFTDFTFDASNCSDLEDSSAILQVRWDWDGDGSWDTDWSTEKMAHHTFSTPGNHSVMLEVRDTAGQMSNASVVVEVSETEIPEFSAAVVTVVGALTILLAASRNELRGRRP